MYFRDQKQKFKSNPNLETKFGFLYTSFINGVYQTKVINISHQQDDSKLTIKQIYNKYQSMIQEQKNTISILEYFQVDDQEGEDVQYHLSIVQCQLHEIYEQFKNVQSC